MSGPIKLTDFTRDITPEELKRAEAEAQRFVRERQAVMSEEEKQILLLDQTVCCCRALAENLVMYLRAHGAGREAHMAPYRPAIKDCAAQLLALIQVTKLTE